VPKLGTMIALLCFVMAFLATPFKSKCFGRRAACRPRKMQRAAGQHDNLAGLPLTHACEGRHRRSIASGHWHCPPPWCTGRMVAPTCYARVGFL